MKLGDTFTKTGSRNLLRITLILTAIAAFLQVRISAATDQFIEAGPALIHDFQLVSGQAGWIQFEDQLFWTYNNGDNWQEITPPMIASIRAVHFSDPLSGFLISESLEKHNLITYSLYTTGDGGINWQKFSVATYPLGQPEAENAKLSLFFLDDLTGWLIFRRSTSANFNVGYVLRTTDGGQHWQTLQIPVGEPAVFFSPTDGLVAGGVDGQTLYQTKDSGTSWYKANTNLSGNQTFALPHPRIPVKSIAAFSPSGDQTSLRFLTNPDDNDNWNIAAEINISEAAGGYLPTSSHDSGFVVLTPTRAIHYGAGSNEIIEIPRETATTISQISFISPEAGWALVTSQDCPEASNAECAIPHTLYNTSDGGKTWISISTPTVLIPQAERLARKTTRESTALLSRTAFMKGQGFDQCEISSLQNLQTWRNNSPLSAVNLYIGGVARACANINLSQEFVEDLSLQGWKFIPTWVGPQASCTNYSKTMSSNPTLAFNQGRDNAIDAARVAMKLGLSEPDQSGTVIYYDLEAFNTNDVQCLAAAKAFINGWVSKLHEFGVTAGLYGSVCASGLDEYYSIVNPPDVIWPAAWVTSSYNSTIDVYGLSCLSDSQWGDQQRVYQYTGAHWETWGNTSMYIDLDAIDGIVADISKQVGLPPSSLSNTSFENNQLLPWEMILNESACTWTLANDPEVANSSSQFLAINRTVGQTDCFGIKQPLSITPQVSDQYRFAVWARSSSPGTTRSLSLDLLADGISPESTSQKFSGITADWVCLEIAHTISQSGQTSVVPSIFLEDLDGIDLYLDDAHLSLNTGRLCPNILIPTELGATDSASTDSVFLEWDQAPLATYYKVYRKSELAGGWEFLDRTQSNIYMDNSGGFLDEYYYTVKACNAGACSNYSNYDLGSFDSPFLEFNDGFESGNTDRWTEHQNPGAVSACPTAGLTGHHGLCLLASTGQPSFLTRDLAVPTDQLTTNFSLDPNGFSPGDRSFTVFSLYDKSNTASPLRLLIRKSSGDYQLKLILLDNAGGSSSSVWTTIPNQPVEITLTWQTANNELRSLRSVKGAVLFIDGNEVAAITGADNSGIFVDQVRFGAILIEGGGASTGTLYLDNFQYAGPGHLRPGSP